jgi:hypothetical protein
MRKKTGIAVVISGIALTGAIAAGGIFASQNRYGPITCTACGLGYPSVDGTTAAFISTYVKKMQAPSLWGPPNFSVLVGDVIVLCNGSRCVDYVKNDSGDWEGTQPRDEVAPTPHPPGSGIGSGNGRPGGGGGGYTGPISGGGGGGSGSVTVGSPQPQGPSGPNQEN